MATILRMLLVILVFASILAFNAGLIDVRLQDVDYFLGKAAAEENGSKTLGIVAKYELIKNRLEEGDGTSENFELEAKIQALTSGKEYAANEDEQSPYLIPVRMVLDGIRFVLGKEIVSPRKEDEILHVVEIGYFWERVRKYSEAVEIYDKVLDKKGVSRDIRSAVLLHKAFCHSMISEYEIAKKTYEQVINEFPDTEAGMLAWKLLDFLSGMEEQRVALEKKTMGNLDRARRYYLLMDYRNAIKYLSRFLESAKGPSEKMEARYYKARSHEELGETDEAIFEYRRIIRDDSRGKWARQANRRLLMLGEFYEQREQIAAQARKKLEEYQDQEFMKNVSRFSGMMARSSLRAELMNESDAAGGGVGDEEVMNLINSIGDLDLTGEKAHEKRLAEIRKELESKGTLSEERVDDLVRRKELAENPYRRPAALKEEINRHSAQLKYMYNQKLKRGSALEGRMSVELEIRADGSVGLARVFESTMGSPEFEQAVEKKIENWTFRPVPDSLGSLTIRYPFEFYAEK